MNTAPKVLLEAAMKCGHLLRELSLHEKAAVLQIVGTLLQVEVRNAELANTQVLPPMPPVTDEHYRA